MKTQRRVSKLRRGFYLSCATAFWFFIAASAPHRVHHFFEQLSTTHHVARVQTNEPSSGEHRHDGRENKRPAQQNDCIVLSVAQHAHASVVQSFTLAVRESAVGRPHERPIVAASSFNPAPFSQRAPPLL
jgi:hypothetical protein